MFNSTASAKYLLLLAGLLLLASCQKKHHTVTRGFYYWKTFFKLSNYEQEKLVQAGCTRLYIHCFDVDWDDFGNCPKPLAILRLRENPKTLFVHTPVVFITQKAIAKLSDAQVPELAKNIAKLLDEISAGSRLNPAEIQIDCDWTAGTRERYFNLLRAMKREKFFRHKTLSCTVRLHQVKYRERSGIPPVDRALVMCYNVGNLKQPGAHNSILDAGLAKNYLAALDAYPLPVDIALPLFSWCLHFRDGRMLGILRDITPESIANNAAFRPLKSNLYSCVKDTLWQEYHFLAGDELRAESPTIDALKEVAGFTARKARNDSLSVLFFHADSLTLSKYSPHDLETVYRIYQ